MHYALGHALNTNEFMHNFPTKKLKLTAKECEQLIGNRHKETIAKEVFKYCVNLVIQDIINNNITFKLPTRSRESELYMKRYSGDKFVECRQNGKFADVQYLKSNFSGYQMCFKYKSAGIDKEKLIYLDPKNRDKITEYTNCGKNYC